jgi:hypothetical protein
LKLPLRANVHIRVHVDVDIDVDVDLHVHIHVDEGWRYSTFVTGKSNSLLLIRYPLLTVAASLTVTVLVKLT